jgi:small subunit ribosomal protein S17
MPPTKLLDFQVCSNKMDKTVIVLVEMRRWVNKYQRWQARLHKFMAHDGTNTCNIGDIVRFEQIPKRRRKAFNVIEIVQRENIFMDNGEEAGVAAEHKHQFEKRPAWAGLSPAAADAILSASRMYKDYYSVSELAEYLAPLQTPTVSMRKIARSAARR